jgi:hypothetical protein
VPPDANADAPVFSTGNSGYRQLKVYAHRPLLY